MEAVSAEPRLVLLLESADPVELATVKSLLDGAAIGHVVQGEHHAAMLAGPLGNPAIVPRVLVSEADLERARQLLAAAPDYTGAGELAGEGICPVHEKPSIGTCERCGTFLCHACKVTGSPPLCESCTSVEERSLDAQREAGQRSKRWKIIAILIVFIVVPPLLGLLATALRGR